MPSYNTNTTSDELVNDYASQIRGKVVLTTGVSPGGLGAFFVQSIAKSNPACLILAGRDLSKVEKTAASITESHPGIIVRPLRIDLESLQSVRDAAAEVNAWSDVLAIDVVVNNAAVMACDHGVSADGFERQLAANHLGHFLFTNLIMDKILASSSPRVVNVTSAGHRFSPFRFGDYNFDGGKTYDRCRAYGQSKTANMLMALSLATKLGKRGLLAFSVHPGVIQTNLAHDLDLNNLFVSIKEVDRSLGNLEGFRSLAQLEIKSMERGVATHIYAAFDPNLSTHNGSYLLDCHIGDPFTDSVKPWATSPTEAEKLWKLSGKLVGKEFTY